MAKKFKGFNNQQTHQLLKEMGFTGPAQKDEMDAFIASSPSAGSMLGRYTDIARQRVEGGPLARTGLSKGSEEAVTKPAATNITGGTYNPKDKTDTDDTTSDDTTSDDTTSDDTTSEDTVTNDTFVKKPAPKIGGTYYRNADGTYGMTEVAGDITGSMEVPLPAGAVRVSRDVYIANTSGATEDTTSEDTATDDTATDDTTSDDTADALGDTTTTRPTVGMPEGFTGPPAGSMVTQAYVDYYNPTTKQTWSASTGGYTAPEGWIKGKPDNPDDYSYWSASTDETKVISKGTLRKQKTQASIDLDAAQQEYSTAQKTLTDAQLAVSNLEVPEATPFDGNTAGVIKAEYLGDLAENKYGITISDGDYTDKAELEAMLLSGSLPQDPTKYEGEGTDKEPKAFSATLGSAKKGWTFTYDNGQTITLHRDIKETAIDDFGKLAGLLNDFKATDTYQNNLTEEQKGYKDKKEAVDKALDDAELANTQAQAKVSTTQKQFETTDIPSTSEALGKAISSPLALVTKAEVVGIQVQDNQLIDKGTGQVPDAATIMLKQAELADAVETPAFKATQSYLAGMSDADMAKKYPPYTQPVSNPMTEQDKATVADYYEKQQAQIEADAVSNKAAQYSAVLAKEGVKEALETFAAATGTPSDKALMTAAQMKPEDLSTLDIDPVVLNTIRQIAEVDRTLQEGEQPTAETFESYTTSDAAERVTDPEEAKAQTFDTDTPKATAQVDYTLTPTDIAEAEATTIKDAATFDEYATADEKKSEYLPDVKPEETIVDDTKEIVDINEILNSEEVIVTGKTLEALNEASTAKAQSSTFTQQLEAKLIKGEVTAESTVSHQLEKLMESFNDGTPAWAAGALRRVNAVMAARGLGGSSMAAAAMVQAAMESAIPIAQSDAATFADMNMENLRNAQAVSIANAAAAQKFELANLDNRQQTVLQNSMNNANLSLKNLSNTQEAVLATAQFKASLLGQELDISQNVAISNAARYAAVNDINLTNRQQTSILKSTQNLEVEMSNLSNSQQTALSNLQVKAAMMGQELTNEQQVAVLESTQLFETEMSNATRKQQAFIQDAVNKAAMDGQVLSNQQQTQLFNIGNEIAERGIELDNEQQTEIFNMTNKMTMDVTELSNRQQTALANAQIEAAMKGQELSNKQQVAVIKAENIAEIANMNFTEEQTRNIRNSELAQTVDLANLSNAQAKLMADVAALAGVDMANLNNRQQAQAQQANAFLEMDMANLDNEQQATMFEAQSLVQSILSDQSAENAALQFNADSINQVNQFYDGLSASVDQFNNAQANAMEQFNTGEANAMSKFQAELDNQRDLFNATNELVVAQANTKWRQVIATTNTAAINEANMQEAMAANNLTQAGINELWQQERDLMDFAWTSAEKQADRVHELAKAKLGADAETDAAYSKGSGEFLSAIVTGFISKMGK